MRETLLVLAVVGNVFRGNDWVLLGFDNWANGVVKQRWVDRRATENVTGFVVTQDKAGQTMATDDVKRRVEK
jgi:hypothetical protein